LIPFYIKKILSKYKKELVIDEGKSKWGFGLKFSELAKNGKNIYIC